MTQPPTLRAPRGARRRLSDTSGVTLIEALVALTTGTVLMLALFAILDFSTTQTSRTTDLVQATQLGRNARSHIIDELRSACVELRRHHTHRILLRLITNEVGALEENFARIEAMRSADPPVAETFVGNHLEGPYLSPEEGYRGVHIAEHMKRPEVSEFRRL